MRRVPGVCEPICASDSVRCNKLSYVRPSWTHESSPVLDSIGMGKNQTLGWMHTHEVHKTIIKELAYNYNEGINSMYSL